MAWLKFGTRTIVLSPPVVEPPPPPPMPGWLKFGTRTITLIPPTEPPIPPTEPTIPTGWVKLATTTINIVPTEAPPIPPEYKLIQHTEYPRAKTFAGKASQCTFEFKLFPEQIPGTGWLGTKVAEALANRVSKTEGSEMLDLKIYEDTTPMFWTNYMVIATCIETSPFPWAVVIPLVLAVLFVVAITFLIREIKVIDWGEPLKAIPVFAIILGIGALAGIAIVASKKIRKG